MKDDKMKKTIVYYAKIAVLMALAVGLVWAIEEKLVMAVILIVYEGLRLAKRLWDDYFDIL